MPTPANDLNIQSPGYIVFDGVSSFSGRTFQAGAGITLTNASGVDGNTTISSTASLTDLHTAKWIVNQTPNAGGNQTSIQAAITAASAGETVAIYPGSYTENLILKPGVNLTTFGGESASGQVTIIGKATLSTAGTVNISNIRLQTNSDFCLVNSGSVASIINLNNCYINCTNNTGISFTSSSASAAITLNGGGGNLGTTGIAYFASSSAGTIGFVSCNFGNSGGSTTANTVSAGAFAASYSSLANPTTGTGTSAIILAYVRIQVTDVTALTVGGSGANSATDCNIQSGTATAISVGSTMSLHNISIVSTNVVSVAGAGTINFSDIASSKDTSTMSVTTQNSGNVRAGIIRSTQQPAFIARLASTASNKTGAGTSYTLGTDALTLDKNQSGGMATNGTFTAPYDGFYQLSASVYCTGCTVATAFQLTLTANGIAYVSRQGRAASAADQCTTISCLAYMTAASTATVAILVAGEAGDTVDILGNTTAATNFCGYMVC